MAYFHILDAFGISVYFQNHPLALMSELLIKWVNRINLQVILYEFSSPDIECIYFACMELINSLHDLHSQTSIGIGH